MNRHVGIRGAIGTLIVAVALLVTGLPGLMSDTPVAAQSTDVTLISNLGQANKPLSNAFTVVGTWNQQTENRLQATSFTTGSHEGGYALTELNTQIRAPGNTYVPKVSVYTDSNGKPGVIHTTLTNPSTLMQGGSYFDITFSAPSDAEPLDPGTYWVVFENLELTASANRYHVNWTEETGEDAGGQVGWSIGDVKLSDAGSADWATSQDFPIKIKLTGREVNPAGVTLSKTDLTIAEGASGTYTVVLNTDPDADVTITPFSMDVTLSTNSLTFTTGNWDSPQTVTVTATDDNDLAENLGFISHGVSGYAGVDSVDSITVTINDLDTAHITVNPTTLTVNEEATATYTVVLDFRPSSSVTVTVIPPTGSDVSVTSDTTLTFTTTDWATAQVVTVAAADDDDRTNDSATIRHTASQTSVGNEYNGITVALVAVTVNDNDVIELSESSLTIAEGSTGQYTVNLAQQPSSTVTVNLAVSAEASVSIDKSSLSFTTTDWSATQTVTVTATDDADGFNNTGTITHSVSGGLSSTTTLSTTVTDDEDVKEVIGGAATYNMGGGYYEMTVTEGTDSGTNNQFTVKLSSQPYPSNEDVTFTMNAPSGSGLTFKKAGESTGSAMLSLIFTGSNWSTPQTVTVGVEHDDDSSGVKHTMSIGLSGANFVNSFDTFDMIVQDDDSPGLEISKTSFDIVETNVDVTNTYTVRLQTLPTGTSP